MLFIYKSISHKLINVNFSDKNNLLLERLTEIINM